MSPVLKEEHVPNDLGNSAIRLKAQCLPAFCL